MPEFDVTKFIAELEATGELTPEEKAMFTALAGKEKAGKVLKSGFAAQSEFSSRLNKLTAEQKTKMDELIALQEELRNSSGASDEEIQQMRDEMALMRDSLAETEGKLAAAKVKARTFNHGEDFLKETGIDGITIKTPEKKAAVDPNNEPITYGRALGAIDNLVNLNFDVNEFNEDYYELTGKYPSAKTMRAVLNSKEAQGKRPYDVLTEHFKVGELKATKAEEAIQQRLAAARKEGEEAAAAKYAIPSGSAPFVGTPPPLARVIGADAAPPAKRQTLQEVRTAAINAERTARAKRQSSNAA
jgi:hypothetical protein